MAEPKEIGTVWTLGCDVFVEDALTAEVQEIKVNDIALSANIFTEGLSVEVGSDKVNAMDLDVRISMDGLKTYIIDSQIVPYDDVLKITDFSPEATNEKRYASSANTSKKIIDSVSELEGRVNVAEGDIDALEKRVDDLELKGTGGSGDGFWYLGEDGKIHSDQGIVVRGDAIIEGDTSSGGEGEPVIAGIQGVRVNGTTHYDDDGDGVVDLGTIESGGGGGLTSVSWGDIQGTPPSVSTFNNDVPYVTDEELRPLGEEIELLSSMWHLDENGNLVTDKQVLIKNNLIIDGDTSSGGEGESVLVGVQGISVNGGAVVYPNSEGIVELTISGGGGTADLSNYYTKGEADARYLASSLLGSNTLIHSGNIGSQSVASARTLVASDGTTYVSYNSTYGQVNVNGINIGYGGNTIETASGGVLNIQANSTGGTIISPYGGNVLIGTATDSGYKLDVNGDIATNQYLCIKAWTGYGSGSANAWYNGNTQMLLWENVSGIGLGSNVVIHSGNIGSYAPIYNASGNVTIGASDLAGTSAYAKLCIDGVLAMPKDDTRVLCGVLGFSEGNLYLGYSNVSTYDTIVSGKNILFNPSNGNVGIGTASPAYKLDVNGSIAASESLHIKSNDATADIYPIQGLYEKEAIAIQTAFDKQDPQTSSYPSSYPTRVVLALQPRGGYVGIGTTTPQYKLDVNGDSRINGNLIVSGDVASA